MTGPSTKRPAAYVNGTATGPDGATMPAVRWRDGRVNVQDATNHDWRLAHPSIAATFQPSEETP